MRKSSAFVVAVSILHTGVELAEEFAEQVASGFSAPVACSAAPIEVFSGAG